MNKRIRHLFVFTFAASLGVLGLAAWLHWQPPGSAINAGNVAKIEIGMTLPEVQALLGGPSRRDGDGDVCYLGETRFDPAIAADCSCWSWSSDECLVLVYFQDDRVRGKDVSIETRSQEGLLAKLRRWLHL